MISDILLGFLLTKVLGSGANQRPTVLAPQPPGTRPPRQAETPANRGKKAPPKAAPAPAPPFPANVDVPTDRSEPGPGFKKAVEIWHVNPAVAALKDSPFVVGNVGAVNEATALEALQNNFPNGWKPLTTVTDAERNMAIALLDKWKDGGVTFLGPATFAGRRAFRMTQHPKAAQAPSPAPARPAPTRPAPAPAPTVPASSMSSTPKRQKRKQTPAPGLPPMVQQGSSGDDVVKLQKLLNDAGATPPLVTDGKFGPRTATAVKAYQKVHGLKIDGIVGNQTWGSLLGQAA